MRYVIKMALRTLMHGLPRSKLFFLFCRYYVNRYSGDNNCDMATNGEFRWLREVAPHCMTVFDVGANVGDFAASALESNPQMSVHLFEPSGAAYRALQTRVFGGKVHLNFFGLSSSTREGILHVFADSSGINSLEKRVGLDVVQNATERIKLETLDGVCANSGISQIDLLKIDV